MTERERAARFRFDRDRERFVTCRAALRRILGRHLDRDPVSLAFQTGMHGRPSLSGDAQVEFNVSHSGDLALIAVCSQGPLGVDVEALRDVPRALDLARRYLHPNEIPHIEAAPPEELNAAWLTVWTRKEAALKSIGAGLTVDTRKIEVGATKSDRTIELATAAGSDRIRICSLEPQTGYFAACALAEHLPAPQLIRFDD